MLAFVFFVLLISRDEFDKKSLKASDYLLTTNRMPSIAIGHIGHIYAKISV